MLKPPQYLQHLAESGQSDSVQSESGQGYDLTLDTAGNHSLSHLRSALASQGALVTIASEGSRL